MKNKNVIIFGGSGFLGSHLADSLSDNGYNVTTFDNQKSKWKKNKYKEIIGDISNLDKVSTVLKNADYVYHFAAIADIEEASVNPLKTINVNIIGTTNILESCIKNKIKRLCFASSLYVNSNQGGFYSSSKKISEILVKTYSKSYGLNYSILRFGSLYGPRSNNTNYIHRTIIEALKKNTISRKGNGNELRNYIHVKDAADISVKILANEYKNKIVTISGLESIKIKDLLNMISEMFNTKIKIKYTSGKMKGHYKITPYSFEEEIPKRYIGESRINLEEGLFNTIKNISLNINKK